MAKEASADLGLVNTGGHPNACIDVLSTDHELMTSGRQFPFYDRSSWTAEKSARSARCQPIAERP